MTFVFSRHDVGGLPTSTTSFVGRRREIEEAKRLLSGSRMVTLTGVGGVGKTRLGLEIAAGMGRAFSDGVWLVELADIVDGRLIAPSAVDVFGIQQLSDTPVRTLCEFLASRQVLLVLDNCEHVLEESARLAGELLRAAPGLRILATSRQPLDVSGEHILEVTPLPVPPAGERAAESQGNYGAVALFVDRVRSVRPDFALSSGNARAVGRLCRGLDGIPLAIELAAVWTRSLSLEQMVERLDDRLHLLTGRGWRAVPPRQQTLRAAIDWSYELCTVQERLLWARLSVFSSGLDLEAAEEVCAGRGLDRQEILGLVSALVDKSIIVRTGNDGSARYRLLETIRQYGREKLAASGQEAVVLRRHRDWYRHLAQETEASYVRSDEGEWRFRMIREHPNLRAAVEFSLTEPGGARSALVIASSLWMHWFAIGTTTEARHWLRAALADDQEPSSVRAKALWAATCYAVLHGDTAEAQRRLAECRRLAEEIADETALAYALVWEGWIALAGGDVVRSVEVLTAALVRHEELDNDDIGVFTTMYALSQATMWLGDSRAATVAEDMLARCQARGMRWGSTYAMWALGLEMFRQRNLPRAMELLRESIRIRHSFHDPHGVALSIEVLAWTTGAAGLHMQAAELLGAAEVFWRTGGTSPHNSALFATARQRCEAEARKALGDRAFQAAVRRGGERERDEAVALALGRETDSAETAAPPAVLTPREREVALLVAEGLSSREIAARLVIAPRTAEAHVDHILTKLGFRSRTQIATWITDHQQATSQPGARQPGPTARPGPPGN